MVQSLDNTLSHLASGGTPEVCGGLLTSRELWAVWSSLYISPLRAK